MKNHPAEFVAQQADDSSVAELSNDEDFSKDYLKVMGHVKLASEIAAGADNIADDDPFFANFFHEARK